MTIRECPSIQAIVGPGGKVDPHWQRWFGDLARAVNSTPASTPAPAVEYPSFVINGAGSVTADGAVAAGEFSVTLVGDKDSPPLTSFYGADSAGEKGFVPLYDGLEEGTGIALRDSGYIVIDTVASPDDLPLTGNTGEAVRVTDDEPGLYAWDGAAFTLDSAATGIVNVALADLADTGVGAALVKITRDAKGRVEGTETATAADLAYDNATSGLTATDVQAAIDEVVATVVSAGAWLTVKKSTDETRTATTTLADDSALTVNLAAGSYVIRLLVYYSIANATMDFKYAVASSGAVVTAYGFRRALQAGNAGGAGGQVEQPLSSLPNSTLTSSSAGTGYLEVELMVETSASGTVSFQWAQNTSDAGDCKVLKGSRLEYFGL